MQPSSITTPLQDTYPHLPDHAAVEYAASMPAATMADNRLAEPALPTSVGEAGTNTSPLTATQDAATLPLPMPTAAEESVTEPAPATVPDTVTIPVTCQSLDDVTASMLFTAKDNASMPTQASFLEGSPDAAAPEDGASDPPPVSTALIGHSVAAVLTTSKDQLPLPDSTRFHGGTDDAVMAESAMAQPATSTASFGRSPSSVAVGTSVIVYAIVR